MQQRIVILLNGLDRNSLEFFTVVFYGILDLSGFGTWMVKKFPALFAFLGFFQRHEKEKKKKMEILCLLIFYFVGSVQSQTKISRHFPQPFLVQSRISSIWREIGNHKVTALLGRHFFLTILISVNISILNWLYAQDLDCFSLPLKISN